MNDKAIVLFSGGQDSTTCLYDAISRYGRENVVAVSIFYGQRHSAELDAARDIVALANVQHVELETTVLSQLGDSALVTKTDAITGDGGYGDSAADGGLPTSFVPGRNMIMMAFAASVAVKYGATAIVSGVCQTDYSGYPDCRREFVDAMQKAATLAMPSDCGPIEIVTPLMYLTKAQTVALARVYGPECWKALGMSMTCYHGQRPACGVCPACELRAAGFAEEGEVDPSDLA
jgi:7-cyano-7-deazaguanine synthase